jgi:hypothetical protein
LIPEFRYGKKITFEHEHEIYQYVHRNVPMFQTLMSNRGDGFSKLYYSAFLKELCKNYFDGSLDTEHILSIPSKINEINDLDWHEIDKLLYK